MKTIIQFQILLLTLIFNICKIKKNMKCKNGWHDGSCCCNCKHQIELFKHPSNKNLKGAIKESTGMYACIVFKEAAIIFEKKHGMCELHTPINEKTN